MPDALHKPKLHRWIEWVGLALFFALPFGLAAVVNGLQLLFMLLLLLAYRQRHYSISLRSWHFLWPALFLLWQIISLFWTSNEAALWANVQIKMGLVLASFFVLPLPELLGKQPVQKILRAFVWGCLGVLAACLLLAAAKSLQNGGIMRTSPGGTYVENLFTYSALSEDFMHPGYLSTYIGIALLALLYQFLYQRKRGLGRIAAIAFLGMGLFLLQGRMQILALLLVLGGIVLQLLLQSKRMSYLWGALIALAGLAVVFWLAPSDLKQRYMQLPDFNYDISGDSFNSATYRLAEWHCAWDVIEEQPWVGVGLGDAQEALFDSYRDNKFYRGYELRYNVHNQYLETSLATGLIGGVLLLMIFVYYSYYLLRRKHYMGFWMLLFFALCLLTESMFERAWAIALFGLLFPLLHHYPTREVEKSELI